MLSDQNATMLRAIGANHRLCVCAGRIGTRSAAAGSDHQAKKNGSLLRRESATGWSCQGGVEKASHTRSQHRQARINDRGRAIRMAAIGNRTYFFT